MAHGKRQTSRPGLPVLAGVALLLSAFGLSAQTISTVAGGLIADNQPALATPLINPVAWCLTVAATSSSWTQAIA